MAPKGLRQAAQMTKEIREAVQNELAFDLMVDSFGIAVKNMNGDVNLSGAAPSYPQYLEAAAAARRVQGVTGAHNHLMLDAERVVDASEGTVMLAGHVRTRAEHDTVMAAAWRGVGVKKVCDYVVVMG